MPTYLTADLHLGHRKVSEERGFSTTDSHTDWIRELWLSTVTDKDTVFVLGDISVGKTVEALDIIKELPGTKHLISGNHDRCHPMHRGQLPWVHRYGSVFDTVQPYATLRHNKNPIALSHFPYEGDHTEEDRHLGSRLRDNGAWLLHGHVHGQWKYNGRQINVGLDPWERLVSFDEITGYIDQQSP